MTTRYPGGLIRKTPPTITPPVGGEGGSAPGVWTLEQASYYTKTGTWPKPILAKSLYVTGGNSFGVLGLNDSDNRSSPVQVGSATNWSQVSTNVLTISSGVRQDGTLWTWGAGTYGGLGQNDSVSRSSPTQVGALTTWSLVASGYYSTYAIKNDGTLWSWGLNNNGQLGINNRTAASSPVQVGSDTNWYQVSVAIYVVGAIKTNGTLWMWGAGQGTNGQLGLNDNIARSSPTQVGALTTWLNVCNGQYASVATKTDGTIWAWGVNVNGVLGDGTVVNRSSPVQIGALTSWSLVKTSGYVTSMARKTDGTLWSWGRGTSGGLGLNAAVDQSSPVQIGSGTNWSSEFVLFYNDGASAIKTDGTLWGWGVMGARYGTNNTTTYSSPVQIGSDTTWLKVSANSTPYNLFVLKKA